MDIEDEVREKSGAKRLPKFSSAIRFEDVAFSYHDEDDSRDVLHGINLEVKSRRGAGRGWVERRRQEYARPPDPALL